MGGTYANIEAWLTIHRFKSISLLINWHANTRVKMAA